MVLPREADRTPSFNETVRLIIEQVLADVHVCLPGRVENYNSSNQTASVQPSLKRGYDENGNVTVVNLPVIPNVPVCHPRANNAWIHLPVKSGDSVLLIISERSLDVWKAQGGIVNPADRRKFNLTDAFAIPGGYSPSSPFTVDDPNDVEIKNDTGKLSVKSTGKFVISNGTVELLDQLSTLLDHLINAQVLTMMGPQPFLATTIANFQQVKDALDELKE